MLERRTGAAKTIAGVQEAINLRAVARPLFYLVEIPRNGDQRVASLFVGDVAFVRHRLSIAAYGFREAHSLLFCTKATRLDGRDQFQRFSSLTRGSQARVTDALPGGFAIKPCWKRKTAPD